MCAIKSLKIPYILKGKQIIMVFVYEYVVTVIHLVWKSINATTYCDVGKILQYEDGDRFCTFLLKLGRREVCTSSSLNYQFYYYTLFMFVTQKHILKLHGIILGRIINLARLVK